MNRNSLTVAAALAIINLASPAHAVTVNSAIKIEITSAINDYIQIAEVIATQAFTGIDVALFSQGATASAPDQYSGVSGPDNAIDGIYPRSYYDNPGIYHSLGQGSGEFLLITLANPANLSSLTIYGRTDCCSPRDNFNVQIFGLENNLLYSGNLNGSDASGLGTTVTFDVAATPLPSTWTMLIAGFVALGFFAYRGTKKNSAALAAA